MSKHKNLLMILVSLILFAYAGLLWLYPVLLTSGFDKVQFGQKMYTATGLVTSISNIEFAMKPNLDLVISINNWSSKYIDNQDCFDAGYIELKTNAFSPITKKFRIKNLLLKNVKYSNQILPEGINKLAYLPKSFESKPFGTNKIVISSGPVRISNLQLVNITPASYKETSRDSLKYSKSEVKKFLKKFNVRNIYVR